MTASALRDCELLMVTALRASSLPSVLGGLAVLASFARIPKIRNHSFLLLLGIVACDSVVSIGYFFPVPEDRTWQCRLQGWWMHFFPLLSVFLSLLTVVHLFLLITRSKVHHLTHKDIARASGLLVLLALFCSLAPLITDQYGKLDDTSYCWIAVDEDDRSERTGLMMRWWLMYVPIWTICVVCFLLYYKIFRYTSDLFAANKTCAIQQTTTSSATSTSTSSSSSSSARGKLSGDDKVMKAVLLLRWYPVIMLCSWGGLIIKRIYQFYSTQSPCWVYVALIAVLNLQGFWNSLIFLANNTVWQSWYKSFGWEVHDPTRGWLTQVKLSLSLPRHHSATQSLTLLHSSSPRSESSSLHLDCTSVASLESGSGPGTHSDSASCTEQHSDTRQVSSDSATSATSGIDSVMLNDGHTARLHMKDM